MSSDSAFGEERSGSLRWVADSISGMKSKRLKGREKSIFGCSIDCQVLAIPLLI